MSDNNLTENDNSQEFNIKLYYIDKNNNKVQISVEEIEKSLGTNELSNLVKDKNLSVEEKNLRAREILSEYIKKEGLPVADVSHTGLTNNQKRNFINALTSAYLNSYHDWYLPTPWKTYHFTTLGKDIILLKKTKNRCVFAAWFCIFSYLLSWNTTALGILTARLIMFVLTVTLFQLIMRIVEMVVEDSSQW